MKITKTVLVIVATIITIAASNSFAWKWPWEGFVKAEVTAVKQEFNGKMDALLKMVNDIRVDMNNRFEMQNKIINSANSNISDVKNEIHARDVQQNSNNKSSVFGLDGANTNKLVATILNVVTSGYTYIIGLLVGIIKLQSNQINDAKKRDDEFRMKQEESQQKYIVVLERIAFAQMGINDDDVKKSIQHTNVK